MTSVVKEYQHNNFTGEVTIEYSDNSTRSFNMNDIVTAEIDDVTGEVELSSKGGVIDAVVVSDPAVGEVIRKTETGWETVGEIAQIINTMPSVGDVPVWNGTEYINTPSGIKYVEQTGGDYVPGTSYGDVPGTSISLTGLKKGAIVCVFAEATMQTNAGTITVGIHNGTTVKQAFTSTSTTGETKAIINNSTSGVVQDGFLGNFWLLPVAVDGGMTIKMQAKHTGATTPAVRSANIRAFVLNVPGAV